MPTTGDASSASASQTGLRPILPSPFPGGFDPNATMSTSANLMIQGDLNSMAENWTAAEWEKQRRIVVFTTQRNGSELTLSFATAPAGEPRPNGFLISCIWWDEQKDFFVTSTDAVDLLQQILQGPVPFSRSDRERVRNKLRRFAVTVSRTNPESMAFFHTAMTLRDPRPRNFGIRFKVLPWKKLASALARVMSRWKYDPSSSSFFWDADYANHQRRPTQPPATRFPAPVPSYLPPPTANTQPSITTTTGFSRMARTATCSQPQPTPDSFEASVPPQEIRQREPERDDDRSEKGFTDGESVADRGAA